VLLALPSTTPAADPHIKAAHAHRAPQSPRPERRLHDYATLVSRLADADELSRITEVNRFFNRFAHQSDRRLWGRSDHWATPQEFLLRGAGDCEDFAIAKYFALRALGIDDRRLAIVYTRDLERGVAHMVLLVSAANGSEQLVLDDSDPRLLPPHRRPELVAVYGFNTSAVFIARSGMPLPTRARTVRQRHRRWDELLARRRTQQY
jgi:predicted transglutaminase-like cysteine proteinase